MEKNSLQLRGFTTKAALAVTILILVACCLAGFSSAKTSKYAAAKQSSGSISSILIGWSTTGIRVVDSKGIVHKFPEGASAVYTQNVVGPGGDFTNGNLSIYSGNWGTAAILGFFPAQQWAGCTVAGAEAIGQ